MNSGKPVIDITRNFQKFVDSYGGTRIIRAFFPVFYLKSFFLSFHSSSTYRMEEEKITSISKRANIRMQSHREKKRLYHSPEVIKTLAKLERTQELRLLKFEEHFIFFLFLSDYLQTKLANTQFFNMLFKH